MRYSSLVRGSWKWVLTVLAAGLVVVWAATLRRDQGWVLGSGLRALGVRDGAAVVVWVPRWWVEKLVGNVQTAPALPAGEAGARIVRNFRADLEADLER